MARKVLGEVNRTVHSIDVMLYAIFIFIGYAILNNSGLIEFDLYSVGYTVFYVFAFFVLLAYFSNRRKNDYELLFFGLINILIGTYIFIGTTPMTDKYIIADAMLVYSILIVINKCYSALKLIREKNINFLPKSISAVLFIFLGIFMVSGFYTKLIPGDTILGYYLVLFGILSLLETVLCILFRNNKIAKFMIRMIAIEEEEYVVPKVIKEVNKKKPTKKIVEGEIVRKERNIKTKN